MFENERKLGRKRKLGDETSKAWFEAWQIEKSDPQKLLHWERLSSGSREAARQKRATAFAVEDSSAHDQPSLQPLALGPMDAIENDSAPMAVPEPVKAMAPKSKH